MLDFGGWEGYPVKWILGIFWKEFMTAVKSIVRSTLEDVGPPNSPNQRNPPNQPTGEVWIRAEK